MNYRKIGSAFEGARISFAYQDTAKVCETLSTCRYSSPYVTPVHTPTAEFTYLVTCIRTLILLLDDERRGDEKQMMTLVGGGVYSCVLPRVSRKMCVHI